MHKQRSSIDTYSISDAACSTLFGVTWVQSHKTKHDWNIITITNYCLWSQCDAKPLVSLLQQKKASSIYTDNHSYTKNKVYSNRGDVVMRGLFLLKVMLMWRLHSVAYAADVPYFVVLRLCAMRVVWLIRIGTAKSISTQNHQIIRTRAVKLRWIIGQWIWPPQTRLDRRSVWVACYRESNVPRLVLGVKCV